MHLVHFNTAYGSLTNALTHADGLAVVAIMFQADHDNHNYEPLKVEKLQSFLNLTFKNEKMTF